MAKMFLETILVVLIAYSQAVPTEDLRLDSKGPHKIVGGELVDHTALKPAASLQWYGQHYCCGTFILPDWIVTAAHCLAGYQAAPGDTAAWGGNDATNLPNSRTCGKFYMSDKYNPSTMDHDVGLIRLNKSDTAPMPDLAHPCDGTVYTNEESGYPCYTVGWGSTQEGGGVSQFLRGVEMETVSITACGANYTADYGYEITPRMVCAKDEAGGKDACQGDSGGPSVLRDDSEDGYCLWAATSWGVGCARDRYAGVYTWLCNPEIRKWISDTLKKGYAENNETPPESPWIFPDAPQL